MIRSEHKLADDPAVLEARRVFGEQVKARRIKKKLTALELAQICGCSAGQIINIENNLNGASFAIIYKLKEVLGVRL